MWVYVQFSVTCRAWGPRGLRSTTSRSSGSRLRRMSKMMTSHADTELSMLANTKYKRWCFRKGLLKNTHFRSHYLFLIADKRSAATKFSVNFLTIWFLPRRSWKTHKKPGSPILQSGWSMSNAVCPEPAVKIKRSWLKTTHKKHVYTTKS